jgi:hypothetical protein
VSLALGLFVLLLFASPSRASAHTLTFIENATRNDVCVSPGQTRSMLLYDNAGPSDRTWILNVGAGVWLGGPDVHDAYFTFIMIDNGPYGGEVARFEGAAHEWIQSGTKAYSSTLYAHAGSTFDLLLYITNMGSIYRCFGVLAYAAYK